MINLFLIILFFIFIMLVKNWLLKLFRYLKYLNNPDYDFTICNYRQILFHFSLISIYVITIIYIFFIRRIFIDRKVNIYELWEKYKKLLLYLYETVTASGTINISYYLFIIIILFLIIILFIIMLIFFIIGHTYVRNSMLRFHYYWLIFERPWNKKGIKWSNYQDFLYTIYRSISTIKLKLDIFIVDFFMKYFKDSFLFSFLGFILEFLFYPNKGVFNLYKNGPQLLLLIIFLYEIIFNNGTLFIFFKILPYVYIFSQLYRLLEFIMRVTIDEEEKEKAYEMYSYMFVFSSDEK